MDEASENHVKRQEDSARQWPDSFVWRPRRIAVAFTIIVISIKLALGVFIIREYRTLQIISNGEIGSVNIDTLLAPYALTQGNRDDNGGLDIETAFHSVIVARPNVVLRIWRPDGTLFLSTFGSDNAELHDQEDLAIALSGQSVSKLETDGPTEPGFPLAYPYMEIYGPIYDPISRDLVAVGELYQDASGLLRDRAVVERTVVIGLSLTTLGVLAMLALSFRQSEQLQTRLKAERKMTDLNNQLRAQANQARLDATRSNEQVLNLVGAELHDGPVQLLGLVSLMDQSTAPQLPDGTSSRDLIDKVMIELRTISSGLILPELEELSTNEVIALAVERHQALAGDEIAADVSVLDVDLDLPRKICLFRIVQEGLTNATRHGDASIPRLTVARTGDTIEIELRSGSKPQTAQDKPHATRGLGLQGMRRRLDAFGGRVSITRENHSTVLRATLPVTSAHDLQGLSVKNA